MSDGPTADAIRVQCLRHARVYDLASRRQAAAGDAPRAVIFAWGADVSMLQASLFERIVIGQRAPARRYFAASEIAINALAAAHVGYEADRSSAEVLLNAREKMVGALSGEVAQVLVSRVTGLSYLSDVPHPSEEAMLQCTTELLRGLSAPDFVLRRREEANECMLSALRAQAAGESHLAIELAYESDFQSLEAYLVESAVATRDARLWTVVLRWELVNTAMADVPRLPDAFPAAVETVRRVLADGLGQPDGTRFAGVLPAID
ncbi:MAG: hypothetical protein Q7L55_05820 [Actinomycetota bacterium]|nr:hypothetical protein [Actinomycetota bacterium]